VFDRPPPNFFHRKKEMSLVLNQPKWQKFLSLKRQRNIINEPILNGDRKESNIPQIDTSEKQSTVLETPTTKKRKRSEEEIALRKAKKLKSKKKDGQEWKQLSEEHDSQLSAKPNEDEKTANGEAPESKPQESAKTPMSDAAPMPLLATKAKEISKARREEKLREKQKRAKQPNQDTSDLDQKPSQVLQYLEEYRSHIKSGSEWKFKKQHQKWIVKNLYTYAWESDDLVIPYLKSMQGQVRQRLVLGAKELIEDKEGEHGEDVVGRAERVLKALAE
jgi:hypothetical protein